MVLCAVCAGSMTLTAQGRFRALTRDSVAAVPNLNIVTVHDIVQNACYLVFMVEAPLPAGRHFNAQSSDVQVAAAWRDRRLAELSESYQQGFGTLYAGTPTPNVLRYAWEAQTVQSEFDRVVRENELAWLEEQLERMAAAPRIAISGPVPCDARAAAARPNR
jgi:hypothetical protein